MSIRRIAVFLLAATIGASFILLTFSDLAAERRRRRAITKYTIKVTNKKSKPAWVTLSYRKKALGTFVNVPVWIRVKLDGYESKSHTYQKNSNHEWLVSADCNLMDTKMPDSLIYPFKNQSKNIGFGCVDDAVVR